MIDVVCTLSNKKISVGIIGDKRHAKRLRQVVELSKKTELKSIFHPNRKPDHPLGTTDFSELKKSSG